MYVDRIIALHSALADTQLHQPRPPQGSGHDWLLSPTGTSNRPAVVGVVVVVVVVFDADVHNVHVHIATHAPQQLATSH